MSSSAEERAKARGSWPVTKHALGAETSRNPMLSPEDAWNAVLELTREAYSLAGKFPPSIPRSEWPSRLFRPGEPRPDSNGL